MRQNNQFNKALALEVLIQNLLEKEGDQKYFENYDTKKVKKISMSSIISMIRMMADVYNDCSKYDCEYEQFDNNKLSIANLLVNQLLAERNLKQSSKDQVVSLNNLKVFKFGKTGQQQSNSMIFQDNKENVNNSYSNTFNLSYKPCVQSLTPILGRKIKGIHLTTPKNKQISDSVSQINSENQDLMEEEEVEEEEIEESKSYKEDIQINEFNIDGVNKYSNKETKAKIQNENIIGFQKKIGADDIQTVHNSELSTPIKDFFNLRKGLIIPTETEYSSQANTGLLSTDRQFTNYSDLSYQVERDIFNQSLNTFSKKDQLGFPKSAFELNKNSNDNIQSCLGAFQRKQEESQKMPFSISLNIPSISSNFAPNSNFNPMSSFAQINSKPSNNMGASSIGISNFFSINPQQQTPQPQALYHKSEQSNNQINQSASFIQNSFINRQTPLSLSQLHDESQAQIKNSFINPSQFQQKQSQFNDQTSNKFVLNPIQANNLSLNQTILSENISLHHQRNKEQEDLIQNNYKNNNILGQNLLSSKGTDLVSQFLKDKSARSQNRRIVFQKGFEYDNKDFDQFLKYENEIVSSSLWEDYDIRKSKIQNKNLQISQTAIFTKQSCEELTLQSNKHFSNLLTSEPTLVEEEYILHNTIIMLQGIHSDLYQLNEQNCEFYLKKLNITLQHITHESLLIYLEQYVGVATKIYRLQSILNLYKSIRYEQSEQREVFDLIQECLQCMESQLLDLRFSNCSLLELPLQLRQSFREVDLMYYLIFSNYQQNTQFNFDLKIAYSSLPSNSDLLNIIYNKLQKESISQMDQEILFTFFSQILGPLNSNLTQFVITGTQNKIIYKNLPVFLRESYPRIEECSMNLSLLKKCDQDHFNACCVINKEIMDDYQIKITQDMSEIRQIEKQFSSLIESRREGINKLLEQMKYKKELKKAQELENKLLYVKAIKQNFLRKMEIIQNQKKEQHELKLKKAQEELNQLEIRRIQNKYQKLFEQQEEKAQILENQLKENERIKQEQLDSLKNKLQSDFSHLNIQNQQTGNNSLQPANREVLEAETELKMLYEKAQYLKDNQMVEEIDFTPKHQIEQNLQKMYQEKTKQLEEEQIKREQEQQEQTQFLKSIYEQKQEELQQSLVKFKNNSPQKLKDMESLEESSIVNDEEILSNQIKMFSSYRHKQSFKMIDEAELKVEERDEVKQSFNTKMEIEELGKNDEIHLAKPYKQDGKKDQDEQSPCQAVDSTQNYPNIPINIIINACILNVIKSQALVTNEAIMNVVFEKYNIMNIFSFFKKYMFCERGDKIDDFLDVIVKDNCQIELISLYEASSLFDEEDFLEPLNIHQPYIEFKKDEAPFFAYNFLTTNLQDLIKLKMRNCPTIIEVLFNEEILSIYMGIFSHLIKFRYANKILQQKWKQINRNIITWNSNRGETSRSKKQLARISQSLRHKIQNFIGNLQNYLYFDIIENAWKMLNKSLKKCKTFQELILIHTNYLKYIQSKTFLKSNNQIIGQYLNEILQIQVQFVNILENIISYQEDMDDYDECEINIQKIQQLNHKFSNYEDFLSKLINKIREKEKLQTEKLIQQN